MDNLNFEQILGELLREYENRPETDIDKMLMEKARQHSLSKEQLKFLKEMLSDLKTFDKKKQSLIQTKREGYSREVWIQDELEAAVNKTSLNDSEREKAICDIISCINESVNK